MNEQMLSSSTALFSIRVRGVQVSPVLPHGALVEWNRQCLASGNTAGVTCLLCALLRMNIMCMHVHALPAQSTAPGNARIM